MTTATLPATSEPPNNVTIAKYLGAPPLSDGEDPEAYQRILEQMTAMVKPNDPFEEIWLRDIVDLTWEAVRWRRYSAALITGITRQKGTLEFLHRLVGSTEAVRLSNAHEKGDPEALARIKQVLAAAGLSMDAMAATAVSAHIANLERLAVFQRLAAEAEARRNAALNELSKHKAFADLLRKASEVIIQDAEFQEIASAQDKMSALTDNNGARETEEQGEDAEEEAGHDEPEEDRREQG